MAKEIQAPRALKGVGPFVAATVLSDVGDFSRFAHPRQLVAYFGLALGEHSSGGTVTHRGIKRPEARLHGRCYVKPPRELSHYTQGRTVDERKALPTSFTRNRLGRPGYASRRPEANRTREPTPRLSRPLQLRGRCSASSGPSYQRVPLER
ncbi:IS110 family transposase [Bradyrhizobium sp. 153]|nr:IS110 family transposase [Bradyrhizobium sp. 153]